MQPVDAMHAAHPHRSRHRPAALSGRAMLHTKWHLTARRVWEVQSRAHRPGPPVKQILCCSPSSTPPNACLVHSLHQTPRPPPGGLHGIFGSGAAVYGLHRRSTNLAPGGRFWPSTRHVRGTSVQPAGCAAGSAIHASRRRVGGWSNGCGRHVRRQLMMRNDVVCFRVWAYFLSYSACLQTRPQGVVERDADPRGKAVRAHDANTEAAIACRRRHRAGPASRRPSGEI